MGGTFELGDLQAFINYIVQILMSVMMVAMSLLQLSRAQACAHRIKEVLETEPSVENKPEGEICRAALPGRRRTERTTSCPPPGARWSSGTSPSNMWPRAAGTTCSPTSASM